MHRVGRVMASYLLVFPVRGCRMGRLRLLRLRVLGETGQADPISYRTPDA